MKKSQIENDSQEKLRLLYMDLSTLEAALENHIIISRTDAEGKIVYANQAFLKISCYKREEILGQDHRILNSQTHPKEFFVEMWTQISQGAVWRGQICNRAKDGRHYWVETTISPLFSDNGTITGYLSIRYDITERVLLEKGKALTASQVESSSRLAALGEMSAGIAHEIRNPLTVISGKTQALSRLLAGTEVFESAERHLRKILEMVQRISKITNAQLAFSRDSSREKMTEISVAKFFDDVNDLCQSNITAKGVKISFSVEDQNLVVVGRELSLSQVLVNLINNSADAIQEHQEKWIKVECSFRDGNVVIAVTDSGPGIPLEVQKKMMEPFFTTKKVGQGTGLGLSVSIGIIEAHGGKLVYCENSSNTRFEILLKNKQENLI